MGYGNFVKPVLDDLTPANENPGALAGATGANSNDQRITGQAYTTQDSGAIWNHMPDRHKRAARMLACALVSDDPVVWNWTAAVWSHRLTSMELAGVAFAALRALDPETREMVFDAAQWGEV